MNRERHVYRRLLRYSGRYWRGFALALLAMAVTAATEPVLPALLKPLLDQGFVARSMDDIWIVPAAIVGLFLVRGVAGFISDYLLAWVGQKVLTDLRRDLFAHLLRLPASDFERQAAGITISRVVFEASNTTTIASRLLTTLVRETLVVVGLLGWLMWLNWKLTLIAIGLVGVVSIVVAVFSRRMRALGRRNVQHTGELTRVTEEAVHGYKVVKVFGGHGRTQAAFAQAAERLRTSAMKMTVASSVTSPVTQLAASVAVATVVTIALQQSLANQTTVGGFVSFITAMLMLLAPLKHLADLNGTLQKGLASAEAVFEVMDRAPEEDAGTRVIDGRARGHLRFEGVHFRYPGAEREALAGVDVEARPGEVIALVGGSGGGKTTLVNLVPRFIAPTSGRVTLDGVPLGELTLASLRAQIALVSQEIVLFNDTLRANVAFGSTADVDDAAILSALRRAALGDFVDSLPEGLDTMVGERGTRLSGGQRQRLAIARALLKDAPVLLLDEATSALDSRTEREVQQALEQGMQGRTTLVIAHRLSTIEKADRIVVMEGGRVVEQGTHAALLAAGGAYARLQQAQHHPAVPDEEAAR